MSYLGRFLLVLLVWYFVCLYGHYYVTAWIDTWINDVEQRADEGFYD